MNHRGFLCYDYRTVRTVSCQNSVIYFLQFQPKQSYWQISFTTAAFVVSQVSFVIYENWNILLKIHFLFSYIEKSQGHHREDNFTAGCKWPMMWKEFDAAALGQLAFLFKDFSVRYFKETPKYHSVSICVHFIGVKAPGFQNKLPNRYCCIFMSTRLQKWS